MWAHLRSKLLLPTPQSPSSAKDVILPVSKLSRSASSNASMCSRPPTNCSGLAGKLGSGTIGELQRAEIAVKLQVCLFCQFCYFQDFKNHVGDSVACSRATLVIRVIRQTDLHVIPH